MAGRHRVCATRQLSSGGSRGSAPPSPPRRGRRCGRFQLSQRSARAAEWISVDSPEITGHAPTEAGACRGLPDRGCPAVARQACRSSAKILDRTPSQDQNSHNDPGFRVRAQVPTLPLPTRGAPGRRGPDSRSGGSGGKADPSATFVRRRGASRSTRPSRHREARNGGRCEDPDASSPGPADERPGSSPRGAERPSVRYWDASALVPLAIAESAGPLVRGWLEQDPGIVTWAWTRVELASAVERRARQGQISRAQRRAALDRFEDLAACWDEVADLFPVRARALALLGRHPLRAADAAQLGAALLAAEDEPSALTFVCLDQRLATAAEQEGLRVLV